MADQGAGSFAAGLAKFSETLGGMCVDAIQRFAIRAGEKLVEKSPVAQKAHPNRGLFRANWRASLTIDPDTLITTPDPVGAVTVAAIARAVNEGPRSLEEWWLVKLGNPHPSAVEIEQRYGVVRQTAAELETEGAR